MIAKKDIPVDDESVLKALLILQNGVNKHLPGTLLNRSVEYRTVLTDVATFVQ